MCELAAPDWVIGFVRVEPAGDWLRDGASQSHLTAIGNFQWLTLSDPRETALKTEIANQSNQSIESRPLSSVNIMVF